jgi:hypothetical protein
MCHPWSDAGVFDGVELCFMGRHSYGFQVESLWSWVESRGIRVESDNSDF